MLLAVTKHGLFILLREHRDNALEQNLSMLAVTKHGLNHTISGAHGQCFGANPEQRVFSEAPFSTDSRTPPQPPYTVALRCATSSLATNKLFHCSQIQHTDPAHASSY